MWYSNSDLCRNLPWGWRVVILSGVSGPTFSLSPLSIRLSTIHQPDGYRSIQIHLAQMPKLKSNIFWWKCYYSTWKIHIFNLLFGSYAGLAPIRSIPGCCWLVEWMCMICFSLNYISFIFIAFMFVMLLAAAGVVQAEPVGTTSTMIQIETSFPV